MILWAHILTHYLTRLWCKVASTIRTFFLCMILYPDAQARAQAEIDAVIGSDRLPTLSDRNSLPYVWALVLELFRWGPATPQGNTVYYLCFLSLRLQGIHLGAPHRLTEDDVYKGYFIPKGTIIIANQW